MRGWGEIVPPRVPIIGGKRIRPAAVIVPAALGGLVMTAVSVMMALTWTGATDGIAYENPWWEMLAKVCISPISLWGPMTLALTYAYYARRCRPLNTA
ncbi:hypothetical protein [Actinomadura sp. 9N407]|uniref:hypothetical protein n=1 Tax=Actinomadura sp. 9N407 TaxID=3375154 RepID=UPI0037A15C39